MMGRHDPVAVLALEAQLAAGRLGRREFVRRGRHESGGSRHGGGDGGRGHDRCRGDEARRGRPLKLLQWQAPTTFNPHLSSSTKDDLIGTIVYEPLIRVDNDGNFVPFLGAGLPTKENGQLAADLKSAAWKLKPGLAWSDGEPVTAADVVFTWQYIVDPKTASVNVSLFENVDKAFGLDASEMGRGALPLGDEGSVRPAQPMVKRRPFRP